MKLIILCFGMIVVSCNYFTSDKKDASKITSTDSLHAFAPQRDSSNLIADTLQGDSTIKKFFAGKEIDTKNVTPQQLISFAKTLIGTPYKYASTDPKTGFDCSGFITYVFNHFEIIVPRSSIDFTEVGKEVSMASAKQGDIVLFTGTDSTEKFVGHMGIVISNEEGEVSFIHSTSGKAYGVTISPLSNYYHSRYMKTIRIFPQNDL